MAARPTNAVLADRFDTLFDRLVVELEQVKAQDPLARVGIIVPGRALLRWVRFRLGRTLGARSWLGVEVMPLFSLAQRAAPEVGEPVNSEVHRLLIGTLTMPDWLAAVDQPEGMLLGLFRDLYDAGLDVPQLEAARELLARDRWWRRGEDLLTLYGAWREQLEAHGLGGRTETVRRAVDALNAGASVGLDRALWFGIYDLTGVMADLVRVVCRTVPGTFFFPKYADDAELIGGIPHTADAYLKEVFDAVLAPVVGQTETLTAAPLEPEVTVIDASGERGELEAVARHIAALPDRPPWHEIAIVARDVSPYLGDARQIMRRFRIPLVLGRDVPARTWGSVRGLLAICDLARDGIRRERLLDALRMGGERVRSIYVGQLDALDAALRRFGVIDHWEPLLEHLEAERPLLVPARAPRDPSGELRTEPRRISTNLGTHFAKHVRAMARILEKWPEVGLASSHINRLLRLIKVVRQTEPDDATRTTIESLGKAVGRISREAFLASVERLLVGTEVERPGGDGVRLLDVMSARGMSFRHLFLIGLNRRRWPRHVREDPLMPDSVRRSLRVQLGLDNLPVKGRGHAEEALLFEHAMHSAQQTLTICYQRSDDDGNAMVPSPFLDAILARPHRRETVPRRRHDVLAPLVRAGRRELLPERDLGYWLAIEARQAAGPALAELAGSGLRRVVVLSGIRALAERDRLTGGPGPFDGLVGATPGQRLPTLPPTRVEELLRCPWQMFVRRQLSIEPIEAASELPLRDPLRVGIVVHGVHELLVGWLENVDEPEALTWEDATVLAEQWATELLERELAAEPTLAPLARRLLLPEVLERSRALVALLRSRYAEGALPKRAEAKLDGEAPLADGRRVAISARADRLDAARMGQEIADVKTGRPLADSGALIKQLAVGRRLQVAFYHWLSEARWTGFEFVTPEGNFERVGLERSEWERVRGGMSEVLSAGVDLLENGLFVHRSGRHCEWCELTASCTREHYPANRRLYNIDETPRAELSSEGQIIKQYRTVAERGVEFPE